MEDSILYTQIFQLLNDTLLYVTNHWLYALDIYWWAFGLLGGLFLISALNFRGKSLTLIFAILFLITMLAQPLQYYLMHIWSPLIYELPYRLPLWQVNVYFGGLVLSSAIAFLAYRNLYSLIDIAKEKLLKRTSLCRDASTDVRFIDKLLPNSRKQYNPVRYFKKNKIFVGLNAKGKAVHIPLVLSQSSHFQISGTTGSGKGVLAGVILAQAVQHGEAVIVVAPKDDEFLPEVMAKAARDAGVDKYYIDLTSNVGQWNPIAEKTPNQIEEMLAVAFNLSDKGTDADFYRLKDRKSSRIFSNRDHSKKTFSESVREFVRDYPDVLENSPKFVDDIEEMASLAVLNVKKGINIEKAIAKGSVIYIRGSMKNPAIMKLQKMLLTSITQILESRDRETARHACLFLDEFKYLISQPTLEALGTIRDKRAHMILAHQSLGDLQHLSDGLNPESVIASVVENCSIKITYKIQDPDTADKYARMTGSILVDDELRSFDTTSTLSEVKKPDKILRQSERYLIDTNMLQSLPPRCAVIYGNGLADFIFTSPIQVTKEYINTSPTYFEPVSDMQFRSVAEDLLDVD